MLVVNDYWCEVIQFGCDFIYLGQEDLDIVDLFVICRVGIWLGVLIYDYVELDRVLVLWFDYIVLGLVWLMILKQMKWDQQGLECVIEWCKLMGLILLVVIGGVMFECVIEVFVVGVDVVFVVIDIMLNVDFEGCICEWLWVVV